MSLYVLDKNKNIIKATAKQWEEFACNFKNRVVKQTDIGDFQISTIFLMLPLSSSAFFETMVIDDEDEVETQHYKTWSEATKGHDEMVLKYIMKMKDKDVLRIEDIKNA